MREKNLLDEEMKEELDDRASEPSNTIAI